jgi:hypothetical protein
MRTHHRMDCNAFLAVRAVVEEIINDERIPRLPHGRSRPGEKRDEFPLAP